MCQSYDYMTNQIKLLRNVSCPFGRPYHYYHFYLFRLIYSSGKLTQCFDFRRRFDLRYFKPHDRIHALLNSVSDNLVNLRRRFEWVVLWTIHANRTKGVLRCDLLLYRSIRKYKCTYCATRIKN